MPYTASNVLTNVCFVTENETVIESIRLSHNAGNIAPRTLETYLLSTVGSPDNTTEASAVSFGTSVRYSHMLKQLTDENRGLHKILNGYEKITGIKPSKILSTKTTASNTYCIDCPEQTLDYVQSLVQMRYSRRGPCSIYRSLAKSLFSVTDEHCRIPERKIMRSALQAQCRRLYRETLTAERVVRHIDCDGGGFLVSYRAVDSLRKLDSMFTKKNTRRGFLPSKSSLVRAAKKVNEDAAELLSFNDLDNAEGMCRKTIVLV